MKLNRRCIMNIGVLLCFSNINMVVAQEITDVSQLNFYAKNIEHKVQLAKAFREQRIKEVVSVSYRLFKSKAPIPRQAISTSSQKKRTEGIHKNKEMYIDYKNKSYVIKFCNSPVQREEIENYLSTNTGHSNVNNDGQGFKIKLDFTIHKGLVDTCYDDSFMLQSRIGKYAVIHAILK